MLTGGGRLLEVPIVRRMEGGRLWEVVAYERWSHMEVRLSVHINHVPRAYNPFGLGLTNLATNN